MLSDHLSALTTACASGEGRIVSLLFPRGNMLQLERVGSYLSRICFPCCAWLA